MIALAIFCIALALSSANAGYDPWAFPPPTIIKSYPLPVFHSAPIIKAPVFLPPPLPIIKTIALPPPIIKTFAVPSPIIKTIVASPHGWPQHGWPHHGFH